MVTVQSEERHFARLLDPRRTADEFGQSSSTRIRLSIIRTLNKVRADTGPVHIRDGTAAKQRGGRERDGSESAYFSLREVRGRTWAFHHPLELL
jgi:hypothetical protein